MSSTPPPPTGAPVSKIQAHEVVGGNVTDARYDRQIRLWGKQGQRALLEANIVALGATVAVSEALKSILLTGVHSITIVDERTVSPEDIAGNFFLTMEDLGAPIAERVAAGLCELNGDCAGLAVSDRSPEQWAEDLLAAVSSATASVRRTNAVDRLAQLTSRATPVANTHALLSSSSGSGDRADWALPSLILVSNRYADLSSVSGLVRAAAQVLDVPVVIVEARGMTGFLQTYARERVIANPHPAGDQLMQDLRVFDPFPELRRWFEAHDPTDEVQFNFSDADSLTAHSHLPYICILYHAYRRYTTKLAQEREQVTPTTASASASASAVAVSPSCPSWPLKSADFQSLKQEVRLMRRREHPPQEGFQEALENCYSRLNRPLSLPPGLSALFADPRCADPAAVAQPLPLWGLFGAERPPLALTPAANDETVLAWYVIRAVRDFYEGSDAPVDCNGKVNEEEGKGESGPQSHHKVLPFCGHVPDFTTTSHWFGELRAIYQAKHERDLVAVCGMVAARIAVDCAAAAQPQRSPSSNSKRPRVRDDDEQWAADTLDLAMGLTGQQLYAPDALVSFADRVTADRIRVMAKDVVTNVWFVSAVAFNPGFHLTAEGFIAASHDIGAAWEAVLRGRMSAAIGAFVDSYDVGTKRAVGIGLALLAVHEHSRQGKAAVGGSATAAIPTDGSFASGRLFPFLSAFLSSASGPTVASLTAGDQTLLRKLCWEVERVGTAELPSTAATCGALAAQEVIKLVQKRQVPITYPMVYSGIDGIYTNLPA